MNIAQHSPKPLIKERLCGGERLPGPQREKPGHTRVRTEQVRTRSRSARSDPGAARRACGGGREGAGKRFSSLPLSGFHDN